MEFNRVNQSADGATITNSNVIMVAGDVHDFENMLKNIANAQSNNNSILLNELIENSINLIEENINSGYILKSDKLISTIFLCSLDGVNKENKIKLYYYKAIINLNLEKYEEVQLCIKHINDIDEQSLFLYKLKIKNSIYRSDKEMFDDLIRDCSEYLIKEDELVKLEIEYLVVNGKYKEVIEKYNEFISDNEEINYILSVAYLNFDMFEDALVCINKAIEKKNKVIYILIREQSIIFRIIHNIKRTGYITDESLHKFEESYNTLRNLNEQIVDMTINFQVSFYCTILNILLYSRDKSLEEFYLGIPDQLKDKDEIKNILAMFYNQEKRHREAIKIYDELNKRNKVVVNSMCIFEGLLQMNEYKEIIFRFGALEKDDYDNEGIIVSIYLVALINEGQSIDEKMEKFDKIYKGKSLYYIHIIQACNNNINMKRKYFSLLKNNLNCSSVLITYRAIQIAKEMNLIDDEVEILEKSQYDSYEINKMLLETYLKINNKESLSKAQILVNKELEKIEKDLTLYLIKAQVEFGLQHWRESFKYYKLAFEINKDEFIASNIVLLMLQLDCSEDLEKYCAYITSKSSRSDLLMISAMGYDELGKSGTCDELSFQAMYLQGNNNDEQLTQQCIGIQVRRIRKTINDKITEFDCISEDCVCILCDKIDGEIINICINSQSKYDSGEEKVFNAKHISMDNEHALDLIGLKVNDKVELDNKEYIVKEIVDKYVYVFRYYLQLHTKLYPKSKLVRAINISTPEKLIEDMKKLDDEFGRSEDIIAFYKFDNENIGIPLDILTRSELNQYINVIKFLLFNKQQVLYAGERNRDIDLNSYETIVLSLSTIVILYELGQLNLLDKIKEKIIIPKSLEQMIFNCYKNSTIMKKREGGRMIIDDCSRLSFIDNKLIDTDKEWKNIYKYIKQLKTEDMSNFKLDNTMFQLLKFCDICQLESILLAQKYKGILLCDDLFLRRMSNMMNVINSNIVSLVDIATEEENSKLLLDLSDKNYCCSSLPFDIMGSKISNEDKNKAILNLSNNEIKKSIYSPIMVYIKDCFIKYEKICCKVNIVD